MHRCSPRTRPRPGAGPWSPRCGGSRCCWTSWTKPRAAATERAETQRELHEEIDLLWRTSQLRVKAMDPLDEVRTAMARSTRPCSGWCRRCTGRWTRGGRPGQRGRAAAGPAFLRFGSWIGGDRDGNPFVTAQVTREAAGIQSEHVLRALENACIRIGRTLTVSEGTTPPSAELRSALDRRQGRASPSSSAEIAARSPAGAAPPVPAVRGGTAQGDPGTRRRPGLPRTRQEILADLRIVQDSLDDGRRAPSGLRRASAPDLAGRDVRLPPRRAGGAPARAVHERALRRGASGRRAVGEDRRGLATLRVIAWIQQRFGVEACRRYVVSFTRSADDVAAVYELAELAMPDGNAARARRGAAVRDR